VKKIRDLGGISGETILSESIDLDEVKEALPSEVFLQ
jgi:hypothetical protein